MNGCSFSNIDKLVAMDMDRSSHSSDEDNGGAGGGGWCGGGGDDVSKGGVGGGGLRLGSVDVLCPADDPFTDIEVTFTLDVLF